MSNTLPNTPTPEVPSKQKAGIQTFRALHYRSFRLLWISLIISAIGTWMQIVAQSLLVLQITHGSALALGLVALAQSSSFFLFALVGGSVADRVDKRRFGSGTKKQDMGDCEDQFQRKKRSLQWSPSPSTALTERRDALVRNGHAPNGKQLYRCRVCGRQSRENPTPHAYPEARREEILHPYQERSSLRGLTRTFGVSRTTVSSWIKKKELSFPLYGRPCSPRT